MYRRTLVAASIAGAMYAFPVCAQVPISTAPSSSRTDVSQAMAEGTQQTRREQHYRLALDEFLVLVPVRAQEDIRTDIKRSQDDEARAREEKQRAEQLERLARDQLEAQKQEIDAIKARLKIAKNEDRAADVIVLESDKKLAEGAKQLLEKRRDMRRKEIKGWDTVTKLAVSTREAAELELELARARETLRDKGPQESNEEAHRLDRRVNELEKRTLEAQKKRAELRASVAQTEGDVVNSRLQLLKARAKLDAG